MTGTKKAAKGVLIRTQPMVRFEVQYVKGSWGTWISGAWFIFRGVKLERAPVEYYRFKEGAVTRAIQLAKNVERKGGRAQVIIKLMKKGLYQEERTYPRAADPKKSKG